jgi:hypothetical protein
VKSHKHYKQIVKQPGHCVFFYPFNWLKKILNYAFIIGVIYAMPVFVVAGSITGSALVFAFFIYLWQFLLRNDIVSAFWPKYAIINYEANYYIK